MTYFDTLVNEMIMSNGEYAVLRHVVEKELLHRDILQCMNAAGYLKQLTFIGGTCLRDCYHSPRLSEDLDFTGGFDFSKDTLLALGSLIQNHIRDKYQFAVAVSDPVREEGNTDTWKIKVITRPDRADLPAQKINIDICRLPSYRRKIVMIKNRYNIDTGADGLLLSAESLDEILCDKLMAFTLRPNRVKNRDLWDIHYLTQKNVLPDKDLLRQKLTDRDINAAEFWHQYRQRIEAIQSQQQAFLFEMRRFLLPSAFTQQFVSPAWWEYLLNILSDYIIE